MASWTLLVSFCALFALSAASTACVRQSCAAHNLYADYVFLVDSSRSMGEENFNAVKQFLQSFAASVRIGTDVDNVQMQVITFSENAASHGTLQQGCNTAYVNQTIQALSFEDFGDREITKALHVEEATVNAANGFRPGAKHVLVAISSDSFTGTLPESDGLLSRVRAKYDVLLAIGVGASAIKNAYLGLEQFAGSADGTMFISYPDQLQYAQLWIQNNGCPKAHVATTTQAPTPKPTQPASVTCQLDTLVYDIYLLIDSSLSISATKFQNLKKELVDFAKLYTIADNGAQFGLTTVSVGAELFYTGLNRGQTKNAFINKLQILTQDGTDGQALKLAFQSVEHAYLKKFGTRGRSQLAIYVSVNTDFDAEPFGYISQLNAKYGLKTLAVRYGSSADASVLAKVAGGAACVYDTTTSPESGMVAWLQEATCKKSFCQ